MQKSSWLVAGIACTLCVGAGVLLFGNQNAGISGTNEVADRFITQLALETYRPGGIITSDSAEGGTGENSGFIDLSLKKEFFAANSLVFKYKITVRNDGTEVATNFTVKDYKPAGRSFGYTYGGIISNNTVTWTITSLGAGASKTLYIEIKKQPGMLINKAEVCDYEEAGELQDSDSNPCSMRALGDPKEDDEGQVTILTGSTGASHLACVNQACVYVAGNGANTCTNNSGCIIENTGNNNTGMSHLACVGYACKAVAGSGPNTCVDDLSCAPVTTGRSGLCRTKLNIQVYSGYSSGILNFWGQIDFSVFPQPLYQGYSYSPCKIYDSSTRQQVGTVNISQNGFGTILLPKGSYVGRCRISTPNGQQYQCIYDSWFSIP